MRSTMMERARLASLVISIAVTAVVASGCRSDDLSATVSVEADAPVVVRTDAPVFTKQDSGEWFKHEMFVSNSSSRAISLAPNSSYGGEPIGGGTLLPVSGDCGVGDPVMGQSLPSVICTTGLPAPIILAPGANEKLTSVGVSRELPGMSALKPGEYKFERLLSWHYVDESATQQSKMTITYSVR